MYAFDCNAELLFRAKDAEYKTTERRSGHIIAHCRGRDDQCFRSGMEVSSQFLRGAPFTLWMHCECMRAPWLGEAELVMQGNRACCMEVRF